MFILLMIIVTLFSVGYFLFKKVGSKFERSVLIIIGVIYILTLITLNNNMVLGYFMLIAPLYLLEQLGRYSGSEYKEKLNKSFNFAIVFIILSVVYLFLSITGYLFNQDISLLNIILIGIGTIISISLTLELKRKYFKE
ncbi:hypothetical protein KQY27_03550 [Methanobrevibacter sp. TMH8]|uniref:hypothetical protein n=1 Tax=Methanobrevibacter sp. TMH8 TaxID=2848611 RepID=UPI001CCF3D0A|nr:hypothetical protein [Methanobrevibacter sp. TMH8]MBZ9570619.1 hypothetical protein [Methanobrevibacter sp. TMH8]